MVLCVHSGKKQRGPHVGPFGLHKHHLPHRSVFIRPTTERVSVPKPVFGHIYIVGVL